MQIPKPAVALAVLGGLAYGVVARLAFDDPDGTIPGMAAMTLAFIVLVPLATGYLSVELNHRAAKPVRRTLMLPMLTILACMAFMLGSGLEGLICIILILPLFLVFATLGGALNVRVRRHARTRRMHAAGLAAVLLLPYAAAPLESRVPLPDARRTVESRVRIRADAATVWRHVVLPADIRPAENQTRLAHRIGFPHPVTAALSREGVGAHRDAIFEGGITMRETVTEWVPERRMRFVIDPLNVPPEALDEHVRVGGPYFDLLEGAYEIVPVAPGEVELRLWTTHRLSTHFNLYAGFWTELMMAQIQDNLLHVVRTRAEADA
jgi:Ca2+/Na+ antiporter